MSKKKQKIQQNMALKGITKKAHQCPCELSSVGRDNA